MRNTCYTVALAPGVQRYRSGGLAYIRYEDLIFVHHRCVGSIVSIWDNRTWRVKDVEVFAIEDEEKKYGRCVLSNFLSPDSTLPTSITETAVAILCELCGIKLVTPIVTVRVVPSRIYSHIRWDVNEP